MVIGEFPHMVKAADCNSTRQLIWEANSRRKSKHLSVKSLNQ